MHTQTCYSFLFGVRRGDNHYSQQGVSQAIDQNSPAAAAQNDKRERERKKKIKALW
jgi:hypothetical protein